MSRHYKTDIIYSAVPTSDTESDGFDVSLIEGASLVIAATGATSTIPLSLEASIDGLVWVALDSMTASIDPANAVKYFSLESRPWRLVRVAFGTITTGGDSVVITAGGGGD